jgi:hypothetical protein
MKIQYAAFNAALSEEKIKDENIFRIVATYLMFYFQLQQKM